MLHSSQSERQGSSRFEISQHENSIPLSVRVFDFLDKDGVVSRDYLRLVLGHLVVELAKHYLLLVFEFFLLASCSFTICRDLSLELELDISNHFSTGAIIDSQLDHGL